MCVAVLDKSSMIDAVVTGVSASVRSWRRRASLSFTRIVGSAFRANCATDSLGVLL
jgi:hypothetical protein